MGVGRIECLVTPAGEITLRQCQRGGVTAQLLSQNQAGLALWTCVLLSFYPCLPKLCLLLQQWWRGAWLTDTIRFSSSSRVGGSPSSHSSHCHQSKLLTVEDAKTTPCRDVEMSPSGRCLSYNVRLLPTVCSKDYL